MRRGAPYLCEQVYKPGSVFDSHLSKRIVAGALQPPRERTGRPIAPIAVLLRIEFTASDTLEPMGELLPRLSTLTSEEAVYLCCTFPEVAFGGRYPLSLPCGARTFLMMQPLGRTPRLSVPVALLFYLILGGMSNKLQFFSMADIMEVQSAKRGRYHEREGFCIF